MSALTQLFRRHLAPTSTSPLGLEISRARGSIVTDRDGREYLDLLAGMGVANIGHGHPAVIAAIRGQCERYLHAMVYGEYVQEAQVRLAARLTEILPPQLSMAYFTNSGAEAIEGALKVTRKWTGRKRFVAFEGGFHGDTLGALSVGGNPLYRAPFEPLLSDVVILPFGDVGGLEAIDGETAAVIVEPIQAEGGVRVAEPEFLRQLRWSCSRAGALLVFDEVVTGFGRTGRLFAFEHFKITPDVLVLAKSLGGGMPLGAFVSSRKILSSLAADPPLSHVTTFGGHPVSCAAGLAALEVLLRDRLWERAEKLGERFRERLAELPWRGHLREVRGAGLLIGIELDEPGYTRRFAESCFEHGLILNWTLHRDRVIRLAPSLAISEKEIQRALRRMEEAIPRR
ncbi:MAG: aspartate aminotransferase family protein [Candidatus Binatia bacterium]